MKSISLWECGSMSFDRLRTNGKLGTNGIMRLPLVLSLSKDAPQGLPLVLSLSKDGPPSPVHSEPVEGSSPAPFVLSLSKDADQDALKENPRRPVLLEIRHAPAAG